MDKPRSITTARQRTTTSSPPASREVAIELAHRAAAGDAESTRLLLEIVAPSVARAVAAMMGTADSEIDDATQLALIAFIQALPNFRGECSPAHFAMRIAIRTAGATRRRFRARYERRDEDVDVEQIEGPPDGPQAALRRLAVLRLVDRLPEEQAETMALRFVFGWKLHEIAQVMGTPLNTVRSRLRLAKLALLRRIAEDPALAEALDAPEGE
jgi:RNA polymerase sigma-70 factor (ECF subfamily)